MHRFPLRPALLMTGLFALLCLGCGYKVIDGRGTLGVDFERIEIRIFENRTNQPGLEVMVASALEEEFSRRDWLTPTYPGQEAKPDLIMVGTLESMRIRANSFSSVALSVEDRLDLSLDVEVRSVASGEVIWQHSALSIHEIFASSPEPQVYDTNKDQALRRVTALLSERIHDELFQRF